MPKVTKTSCRHHRAGQRHRAGLCQASRRGMACMVAVIDVADAAATRGKTGGAGRQATSVKMRRVVGLFIVAAMAKAVNANSATTTS